MWTSHSFRPNCPRGMEFATLNIWICIFSGSVGLWDEHIRKYDSAQWGTDHRSVPTVWGGTAAGGNTRTCVHCTDTDTRAHVKRKPWTLSLSDLLYFNYCWFRQLFPILSSQRAKVVKFSYLAFKVPSDQICVAMLDRYPYLSMIRSPTQHFLNGRKMNFSEMKSWI